MRASRRIAAAVGSVGLLLVLGACGGSKHATDAARVSRQGSLVATRTLPTDYSPGGTVQVRITVEPPAGTGGYAVEDAVPSGWTLASADNGGSFDAPNSKVKWVFTDGTNRTLAYALTVPGTASGDRTFSGSVSFGGQSQAIGGTTVLKVGGGAHPADTNGDGKLGIDELTAYIQGWKQGQFDDINLVTNAISIWKGGEGYHYDGSATPPYVVGPGATLGSVQASISPADAISAGAKWSLDSETTTHASGDTVGNLAVGSHTIKFSAVSGWAAPADQVVTVAAGQTASASGTYTKVDTQSQTGSVRVDLTPADAVIAGARWTVDGDATGRASGETVIGVAPGNHAIHFRTLAGYAKPPDQTVTVTAGQTATGLGTYVPLGNLKVDLAPAEALSAGARWTLDGDATPYAGGQTVANLPVGYHTVRFASVTGWTAPADQTVMVNYGQTTPVSATYQAYVPPSQGNGALRVDLSPADAVAAGARWTLDSDATPHASGETVSELTPGSHTVTFTAVAGYARPSDQTVTVTADQTSAAAGTYTAVGQVKVDLAPAEAINAGARWTLDSDTAQHTSGQTVANLLVGHHTVRFVSVTGWTAPADQVVTVTTGQTAWATGTYTKVEQPVQTGAVRVDLAPSDAVAAGAKWTLDSDATLHASGETVSGLAAGTHTVKFVAPAGWTAPADVVVTVTAGQTFTATGTYTKTPTNGDVVISVY